MIPLFAEEEEELESDDLFNANSIDLKVDGIRQEGSAELGKQGCIVVSFQVIQGSFHDNVISTLQWQ